MDEAQRLAQKLVSEYPEEPAWYIVGAMKAESPNDLSTYDDMTLHTMVVEELQGQDLTQREWEKIEAAVRMRREESTSWERLHDKVKGKV